jgi:hypothetical protein
MDSRKIVCPYQDWNPGPSSPCRSPCTDYATPAHCKQTYKTKNLRRKWFQARNDNTWSAGNMEIDKEEKRKGRIKRYSHNVRQDLLVCFLSHSNENITVQKVMFLR